MLNSNTLDKHDRVENDKNNTFECKEFEFRENTLKGPFKYIDDISGKNLRKKLIQALNSIFQIPNEIIIVIDEIISILHNSSLIIDDIEDSSILRRGVESCHLKYGIPFSINSANYMYFYALNLCIEKLPTNEKRLDAIRIFTTQLLELHTGQGKDIYWRDFGHVPTIEEYELMVSQKTGGLFVLALKLMILYSTCEIDQDNIERLLLTMKLFGLFFQIKDDYQNLFDKKYMKLKFNYDDFYEGKFSFPILYTINHQSEEKRCKFLNFLNNEKPIIESDGKCSSVFYNMFKKVYNNLDEILEHKLCDEIEELKKIGKSLSSSIEIRLEKIISDSEKCKVDDDMKVGEFLNQLSCKMDRYVTLDQIDEMMSFISEAKAEIGTRERLKEIYKQANNVLKDLCICKFNDNNNVNYYKAPLIKFLNQLATL